MGIDRIILSGSVRIEGAEGKNLEASIDQAVFVQVGDQFLGQVQCCRIISPGAADDEYAERTFSGDRVLNWSASSGPGAVFPLKGGWRLHGKSEQLRISGRRFIERGWRERLFVRQVFGGDGSVVFGVVDWVM